MKNRNLYPGCVMALLLFSTISLQAQSDSTFFQQLKYNVYGGFSLAFPVGETTKEIHQVYKEWQDQSDTVSEFKGQLMPRLGIHFGFRLAYPVSEKISVNTGLQFTQRGYRQKEKFEYHDTEFQYDEKLLNKRIVRINVLEVPLDLSYKVSEKIELFGGFTCAFVAGDSSAQVIRVFEKRVTTNGEYSEPLSVPKERETFYLTDKIHKITISYLAGIRFPLRQAWGAQVMFNYTGKLFKEENYTRNLQTHISLSYHF